MPEIKTFMDGNSWCATYADFKNLEESPVGFGNNPEDATEALLKETLKQANSILIELKPAQDAAEELIKRVKDHVLSTGESFKVDFATVSYRPSKMQPKIDKDGILDLAKSNEDVKKCISMELSKATTAISWKK